MDEGLMTDSAEEAELFLAKELTRTPKRFCPLTRDVCRTDCECYDDAWIHDFDEKGLPRPVGIKKRYAVYIGHCGNAMFDAYREVQNQY